ncbi:hypothetical protein GCM10011315_40890 [Roseovarius pacificus]|nr:hypothetical protein GCM10011315_40890 [Roseovarius pacificus]
MLVPSAEGHRSGQIPCGFPPELSSNQGSGCAVRRILTGLSQGRGLPLYRAKALSFGEGGGAVEFENLSAGEAAFVIEAVENRGVNGGEFLQIFQAFKAGYGVLLPTEWQV